MTDEEKEKFETNEDLFWHLIEDGFKRKIKNDHDKYLKRIEKEFSVIEMGNVVDYFLILWDIIKFARSNGILVGVGRGSAGGSIISYLLDIIQLNPLEFDLLFERFLNEGRIKKSLPDIDTDFPGTKRGVIKKYMEDRYGETQVCSVGTYTALQVKSAIKDLSRQYNIGFAEVNMVTKYMPNIKKFSELFEIAVKDGRTKSFVKKHPDVINNIQLLLHQPKAKSIHACAMLIFPKEKTMFEWVPISCIDGQMVSEWEGPELEAAGFLKEDILGVTQLDKFENTLRLIKESHGEDVNIYEIPLNDKQVYKFFKKGWNGDVFHFGSKGLTQYCKELQPDNIEDLIAGISLYRPGAMENNFHNEYILRKEGKREVDYFKGSENILNKTYGVFVYQEQIMKLCQDLGGLSLVEADDVRKAMVKKKFEELTKYKKRFIPNYVKEFGVSQEYSENVWEAIDKASTYLFNRSHATAYSITGYIGQWLKVHYPIEFWSTAFKFADEDDYANYISEIYNAGNIKISPVDINNSSSDVFTDFKNNTIFWSLMSIKQCGDKAANQIIEERDKNGQYFSFEEFLSRHSFKGSKVNKRIIENLIFSGAFDSLENINSYSDREKILKQFYEIKKVKIDIPSNPEWWWVLQQKVLSGIAFFDFETIISQQLNSRYPILPIEELQDPNNVKRNICIAGYLTDVEEHSGKKGKWCKLTLENNYNFFTVTIWSEKYNELSDLNIPSLSKCLVVLSGEINSYKGVNGVQLGKNSEFIVLQ